MAIAENFISSGRYFINLPISNFHHVNHEILRLNIQWNIRTKKFPLSREGKLEMTRCQTARLSTSQTARGLCGIGRRRRIMRLAATSKLLNEQ